jgi:hypothetical protein
MRPRLRDALPGPERLRPARIASPGCQTRWAAKVRHHDTGQLPDFAGRRRRDSDWGEGDR